MKKFVLSILLMACCHIQSQASTVIMDYQGDTVVHNSNIERNLIINSDDDASYNIAIKPLVDGLTRSDSTITIPLSNVYLNNNREDVYIRYNEYSNLFTDIIMGGVPKNLTAKVRDFGMVPAGIYNLPIEVQATDIESNAIVSSNIFNLQFIVPIAQSMTFNTETPTIEIGASDAFATSKMISMNVPQMIYINSNSNWSLSINTDNLGDVIGGYYVRVISASPNVREKLQDRTLLEPSKEIVIAKGNAPTNNESITVEFSFENNKKGYTPAGNYINKIKYILREENS